MCCAHDVHCLLMFCIILVLLFDHKGEDAHSYKSIYEEDEEEGEDYPVRHHHIDVEYEDGHPLPRFFNKNDDDW